MKTRLQELLQRASIAEPPVTLSRFTWKPYLPIIRVLMEERSHTLMAAVEWLVAQGEIEKTHQRMAYSALHQILARREEKKQRQQLRLQRQFHAPPPPLPLSPAPLPAVVAAAPATEPVPTDEAQTDREEDTESPLLFPL